VGVILLGNHETSSSYREAGNSAHTLKLQEFAAWGKDNTYSSCYAFLATLITSCIMIPLTLHGKPVVYGFLPTKAVIKTKLPIHVRFSLN